MAVTALVIQGILSCGARSGLDEFLAKPLASAGASGRAGTGGNTAHAGAGGRAGAGGATGSGGSTAHAGASGALGRGGGAGGDGDGGSAGAGGRAVVDAGVDACAEGGAACGMPDSGLPECGNGVVEAGEECDDGNQSLGDGCSATCHFEVLAIAGSTCALSAGGMVKCWGYNGNGESGLGDTLTRGAAPGEMGGNLPAVDLGTGHIALAIVAGNSQSTTSDHVCAILEDFSVKCWGANTYGQLGLGDTRSRGAHPSEMGDALPAVDLGGQRAVGLAAGWYHTCALLGNGSVKCWGRNRAGQLGVGDRENRADQAGEMGAALPTIDFGGRRVSRIAAGAEHTCALLEDHSLICWGSNEFGGLGLAANRVDSVLSPAGLSAIPLGTGRYATQVGCGNGDTCALLDDGSVKCWGDNVFNALGLGAPSCPGLLCGYAVTAIGDALPAVALGGRALQLAVGGLHNCALLVDHSLKCWGSNFYGELGTGDAAYPLAPGNAVNLGSGRSARSLTLSYAHTCAVLDDGTLKCWGSNHDGTLGLGDTTDRGAKPNQMGDDLPIVQLGF